MCILLYVVHLKVMSSPKDLDGGAGNIFEIREYLDDSGSVSRHDVLDVSKEMEMMAKVFADIKEESREIDVRIT